MLPSDAPRAAGFLFGFWLALATVGPIGIAPGARSGEGAIDAMEAQLFLAVNAVRGEHGRVALRRDSALDAVARNHSRDMAERHYLAHQSPEGRSPVDRLMGAGVGGFTLAAENVGMTSRHPPNEEILRGWLTSAEHRANLLAPAFNATGVGLARATDGSYYYTQVYVTVPR